MRETERDRDRETDRERDRETERQRDRQRVKRIEVIHEKLHSTEFIYAG